MSTSRNPSEADVTAALRAASPEYEDLPGPVADRLDRVLEHLPPADTLHAGEETSGLRWTERLRLRRARYALVSATAAVIMTVGAVAVVFQLVNSPNAGNDSAGSAVDTRDAEFGEAPAAEDMEEYGAQGEPESVDELDADDTGDGSIAMFATGADYGPDADLLAAMRALGQDGRSSGEVPPELRALADESRVWQLCQDALLRVYGGLPIAVDFARFDGEPAVLALLMTDGGETAVAVTPACADGEIDELHRTL
jgi:hypothetical protein